MTGGAIGSLVVRDDAVATINGGGIIGAVARGSSTITVDGASIDVLVAADTATINIFSGTFRSFGDETIRSDDEGVFNIYGGDFDFPNGFENMETINIYGGQFMIDGDVVALGEVTATSGLLSATLRNGDTLNNFPFTRGVTDTIRLIPEPSAAGLLGVTVLVGWALRRRSVSHQ